MEVIVLNDTSDFIAVRAKQALLSLVISSLLYIFHLSLLSSIKPRNLILEVLEIIMSATFIWISIFIWWLVKNCIN